MGSHHKCPLHPSNCGNYLILVNLNLMLTAQFGDSYMHVPAILCRDISVCFKHDRVKYHIVILVVVLVKAYSRCLQILMNAGWFLLDQAALALNY